MKAPINGEKIKEIVKKPPKLLPLLLAPFATTNESTNHKIKTITPIKSSCTKHVKLFWNIFINIDFVYIPKAVNTIVFLVKNSQIFL